jgi:hypothetical protein
MNLNRRPKLISNLNRFIQSNFPNVMVVKNKNYFYITSDNKETGGMIAGLYTTSINVNKVSELTYNQWLENIQLLLSDGFR